MEKKIDFIFIQIGEAENEQLSSHLLNYACVLLSGYIEVEINKIITNSDKNNIDCKNSIKTIQNATWCKIKSILALIDIELTLELHKAIIQTDTIEVIYNIITTRNDIVHGKDITSLTLPKLKDDFIAIKKFILKTKEIFSSCN